jgi:hypothetical protein
VTGGPAAVLEPVVALIHRVFGAVDRLRECVTGGPGDAGFLQARVRELLAEHHDITVGMGMIAAPGTAMRVRRRILWWQDLGGAEPTALPVDLNPHSLGFYDYGTADWFSVPRESGGQYVGGPYVDVHGTDRYLLTFTVPVVVGGEFLGVVGADVPVTRMETHLLRAWRSLAMNVVIVNADDRVVVGNTAAALPGTRHRLDHRAVPVPDVAWRMLAAER